MPGQVASKKHRRAVSVRTEKKAEIYGHHGAQTRAISRRQS